MNQEKSPAKFLHTIREQFSSRLEFQQIQQRLANKAWPIECGQAVGASKALLVTELARKQESPFIVVTPDQSSAYLLLDDLSFFTRGIKNAPPVFVFPHLELLPYEKQAPELTIRMERLAPIQYYLEQTQASSLPFPFIIVTPIAAMLKRLAPLDCYHSQALHCQQSSELKRDDVANWLVRQGYEFRDLVAQRGDFSIRGDIIDIYSFSYPDPIRIELWGDEIESIRTFNVSTQRSIETVEEAVFYPGNEDAILAQAMQDDRALQPLSELFGPAAAIVMIQPDELEKEGETFEHLVDKRYQEATAGQEEDHEVHLSAEVFHKEQQVLLEPPENLYMPYDSWLDSLEQKPHLRLTEFTLPPEDDPVNIGCASPEVFGEEAKACITTLINQSMAGREILIVCDNTGQESRLNEILQNQIKEREIDDNVTLPRTLVGTMHRGFSIQSTPYLLCTDAEIFGRYKRFRTPPREGIAIPITDLIELKPGDYVVHIDHGIGRFVRLKKMEMDGKEGEFFEFEYADNGVLYVPIEQIDRVGRYMGGDNSAPTLSKLGTKNWERAKAKAKEAIEDMADELLDLYATRQIKKGYAFNKDTPWQSEFEASFRYEETADQWRAIEETKRDMESGEPMDRLICGDVGFGKTEVAIRAAFKSIMDGKQVAILAPTTILCQQHYNTIRERFADYPIQVDMLSRFLSAGEQKEVVQRVEKGDVDVIVGTHRLLSKDVHIPSLGLVIIDEEQRFGVKHKERLRQIRKLVDTLTLTATPIPRTLYMSLSGIRNMSLVSTPPKNRLPIETYVMEWSPDVVENAVLRELSRDGQVYIVHNRVETIYQLAHQIQEMIPDARVCVGHGQMSEHELESVMMQFIRHEYDILVATTIIENGIDIPNVNTIIINRADTFGLSQLYQLRGRVGRDRHRAYCYLLVQSKKGLTSIARRRLLALQEHNQLGSGFHLAMRDMELRGIGNILGRQQHGHIAAIGFDLYTKLLSDTISTLRGKKGLQQDWETTLEMTPKGTIPPTFVESSKQRMALHQRIAKIKSKEQVQELEAELLDIYGKIPAPVKRLIKGLYVRVHANQAGMDTVQVRKRHGLLRYHSSQAERFNPLRILQLDGWNGFKLVVTTEEDNIAIQFHDTEERGDLLDHIIPLIDAIDKDPAENASAQGEVEPPPPPAKPKKKIKSKKLKKRVSSS